MKYAAMMTEALEALKNDNDLFVDMVNELDSWDGFADGFRGYYMEDLDELFSGCKPLELLDKLGRDFDSRDTFFIDTIWGLESCNDLAAHYRANVDEGELLDNIIEKANHLYFSDSDFEELIENIINYDEDEEEEDDAA